MPTFDAHKNFITSIVQTPPSPSTAGTTLSITPGSGALFPAPPFNVVVYPVGVYPSIANTEIVRVTNISADTLTVVRQQESSYARPIIAGDIIALTITTKTITDLESAINAAVGSNSSFTSSGVVGNINTSVNLGNSNTRYIADTGWQFYNPTTTLWHTLVCTGNPPTLGWDAGQP